MKKKASVEIVRSNSDISHSYLIINGENSVVVDCGSERMADLIFKTIENKKMKTEDFSKIVLTHTHFDHVRGVKYLKEKYLEKADIYVHENEYGCLMKGESIIPPSTTPYRSAGYSKSYNQIPKFVDIESSVKKLSSGSLPGSEGAVKIIHVPGHSSGSICLIVGKKMIVGDTCEGFGNSAFVSFAEDLGTLMKSWKRMIECGIEKLLPGHGGEIDIKILEKDYEDLKEKYL